MRGRIAVALACVGSVLVFAASASAYRSRKASKAEALAIVHDAKRTQPCGYNGRGRLSTFRIVSYAAGGVSFKWAGSLWTPPGREPQGCELVFLHAAGHVFHSSQTPRKAAVGWLPFTWGSSPFDNPSDDSSQWRKLGFAAGPPNWAALARSLL